MIDSMKKTDCCGCKMCGDICPKGAISFVEDEKGFGYPAVDNEKCIQCGLCLKKCPSINKSRIEGRMAPKVYSAWNKDAQMRIESTSGGIFAVLAQWIIDKGGVVFGARYKDDLKSVEHAVATNSDELRDLIGSKYFQSDTEGIYRRVKEYVISGKIVLFCGTPCQNSALYSFMGKEYDNLYYTDFICRNINSPKAFRAYFDEIEEKYGKKVVRVQQKNKDNGWQSLGTKFFFEDGSAYLEDKKDSVWLKGFIYGDLFTRESCFSCKFRSIPRFVTDITLGDFWGIEEQSPEDMRKGISVLMINSEKGNMLVQNVSDSLCIEPHSIEEVIPGNRALRDDPKGWGEDLFFDKLNSGHSFSQSVLATVRIRECKKNFNKFKRKVRTLLRRK